MSIDPHRLISALWTAAATRPAVSLPAMEIIAQAYIDLEGGGTGFDLSAIPEGRAADVSRDAAAHVLARRWMAAAKELL